MKGDIQSKLEIKKAFKILICYFCEKEKFVQLLLFSKLWAFWIGSSSRFIEIILFYDSTKILYMA